MTETFKILDRFTGAVRFGCELSAEIAGGAHELKLGFAVKAALTARANLVGANLVGANLDGAFGNKFTTLPSGYKVSESGLIVRVTA